MADIAEELSTIREQLAVIKTNGENTLTECKKTNGRVTRLEEGHHSIKLDLAVLDATLKEKITVINRDIGDIAPLVKDSKTFMDILKGNWQSIMIIGMVVGYIVDKFVK